MNGFEPDRIAMLSAGSGLLVGSVSADGEPLAVRAWSASVIEGGPPRVRVAMSADDPIAVANVEDRYVAVTAADVRTLDSVQLKGRAVATGPPDETDLALVHAQSEAFFAAIHETDGDPVEQLRKLLPDRLVMIEVVITEVFDQSPGPGAGSPVRATR